MHYNRNIYEKYLEKAIKSSDELVIGQTYYTNDYNASFVVYDLLTQEQSDLRHNFSLAENPGDDYATVIRWYVTGPSEWDISSLLDHNIGAHYNPWMIFKNEEDAIKCREELVVTYDAFIDLDFNDYRDYDDDLVDDIED